MLVSQLRSTVDQLQERMRTSVEQANKLNFRVGMVVAHPSSSAQRHLEFMVRLLIYQTKMQLALLRSIETLIAKSLIIGISPAATLPASQEDRPSTGDH